LTAGRGAGPGLSAGRALPLAFSGAGGRSSRRNMITKAQLKKLAREHGTPLFVVDHDALRKNYRQFRKYLPRVQAYYAVKANPLPEIVRTFFLEGASFDVASMPEFNIVYDNIRGMPDKERQDWIWDKIIYANPNKPETTLEELNQYKPLVTFDNAEELVKIRKHAPQAGVVLRLKVMNTGAMVELSSKFGADPGEAVDLILRADKLGLTCEGLSFHVGSQTTNFDNYVQALALCASLLKEARDRGYKKMNLVDIGGGFPAPYDASVKPFHVLAKVINRELDRLFPKDIQILAEPGRFLVATAGYSVSRVIGKALREGKPSYYINDGVYHTYSGVIFDHCKYPVRAFKRGPAAISAVYGPTCDALDVVSMAENLPDLERDDLVYSENIGAYSHASATYFNGFPPAKVVHVNT
jgi:ornithine decarboxylase